MKVLRLVIAIKHQCAAFLFAFLVIPVSLSGQKILPDTFYIPFRYDSVIDLKHLCIREMEDKRDDAPNFVRYETRRKYVLIPVDQEVYTTGPLAEEIIKGIACDPKGRQYRLEIEKFAVEKRKGRLSASLFLQADIPVYEYVNDSTVYRGTFYYDYLYFPSAKKESLEQSTTNILAAWHTEFKLDLLNLNANGRDAEEKLLPNFISDPTIRSLYVNASTASFAGKNWWGVQGEVYFVRPETGNRNHSVSGIFRYQNTTEYQSFALGKQSEHYTFRQNPMWVFDIDFNFLIGFCKWKDIELNEPTLYQLFDFEMSSVQSIIYDPANKRAMTFRLGLIENLNYVIERNIKFQAGILFGLGIKL